MFAKEAYVDERDYINSVLESLREDSNSNVISFFQEVVKEHTIYNTLGELYIKDEALEGLRDARS